MKKLLETILFSVVPMFGPYILDAVTGDKNFTPVVPEKEQGHGRLPL